MANSLRCLRFFAFLVLLALASCSGTGESSIDLQAPGTGGSAPVVSIEAGPVAGSLIPDVSTAQRMVSASPEERFKFGAGHLPGAASRMSIEGTAAVFSPDYEPAPGSVHKDIAFCIFGFHLPDVSVSATVTLGWGSPPVDWGNLWIGAGRVSSKTWDWLETDGSTIEFTDIAPYINDTDDLVLAFVLTGTGQATLDWLRFGEPVGPVADLTVDPAAGNLPLGVTFDATGSVGRDADLANVIWDFDNNGMFSEEGTAEADAVGNYQPEFTFEEAGTHTVTVRVSDTQVLSDTASVQVEVINPVLELSGTVTGPGATGMAGVEVSLSGDESDSAMTDTDGNYGFSLSPGQYTVAAADYGWFFNPREVEVELVAEPVTDADFTASGPWLHTWGGSGEERINDLVIDAEDNLYVVGHTMSFTSGSGDREVLIMKYNCYGGLEWIRTWGGTENEIGQCATLGKDGDLYVTGYTTSFGEGGYDIFVVKITPDGTFAWETVWGNVALQEAFDVAVDAGGNLYVAGRLSNKTLLLKLNSAGQQQWGRLYWGDGSSFNYANEIVMSDPHIYLAGHTYYTDNYNGLVLQYATDGTLNWAKEWSSGTEDMFDCIGVDSGGGIVCAGHTNNGSGAQDGVMIGLNQFGDFNYQMTWGTDKFELFYGMTIVDDTAYLAGLYGDSGRGMLLSVDATSGTPGWGRGFNMDIGTETTISYCVGMYGNGILVTGGGGPNINGAWDEITGTVFAGGGTLVDPTGRTNNTNSAGIVQSAVSGTVGTPTTAVIDTGGGGNDAALYMYLPTEV